MKPMQLWDALMATGRGSRQALCDIIESRFPELCVLFAQFWSCWQARETWLFFVVAILLFLHNVHWRWGEKVCCKVHLRLLFRSQKKNIIMHFRECKHSWALRLKKPAAEKEQCPAALFTRKLHTQALDVLSDISNTGNSIIMFWPITHSDSLLKGCRFGSLILKR